MKIEAGKYYRTRDGQKVGPLTNTACDGMVARFAPLGLWFRADGRAEGGQDDEFCPQYDLIAEWRDEPDLTAIKTPFGLLDRETQEALKAHGGPYEYLNSRCEWKDTPKCDDVPGYAHRVKPAPPKPRTGYVSPRHFYESLEAFWDDYGPDAEPIRVTEQLPDQP